MHSSICFFQDNTLPLDKWNLPDTVRYPDGWWEQRLKHFVCSRLAARAANIGNEGDKLGLLSTDRLQVLNWSIHHLTPAADLRHRIGNDRKFIFFSLSLMTSDISYRREEVLLNRVLGQMATAVYHIHRHQSNVKLAIHIAEFGLQRLSACLSVPGVSKEDITALRNDISGLKALLAQVK